ncbi:extracellular solute-binding protein [Clostridium swellfunianum]|uniref:extracellular solute-binding protein n=1 Tax=Clostridium swellfunianum TaxID=1367462 RepID=UPI00202E2697|nr:extracellular solute-binding protein [Clostridium swellfunianum]MCM0649872.1 extracellular solute-binding protein [Clostridium swellfunianum]
MKRTLAIVLSAVLVGGSLIGCKKEEAKPVDNPNAPKPTLRFLGQYDRFDLNADPVAKTLEEKTGYKVNYESLPAENPDEKLNLLMTNKEEFDVMKLSAAQYYKLASEGALEPIDTLVEKYGTKLKEVISQTSWNSAKINGKTYGVPEKASMDTVGTQLAFRQDILDELKLQVPKTTDELYTVLKTIKEKKNMIPLTLHNGESLISEISGAFGITTSWNDKSGTLVNRVEEPAVKEYLAFMNKLYAEGLIDTEMPTNNGSKVIEKFTSGKAAAMRLAWWSAPSVYPALQKNFANAKVTLTPPLKGKDGKSGAAFSTGISWYIAIPKASKHKEDAMKWMDIKMKDDVFKSMAIGEENVHYTKKDGAYYPILPKFFDERNNASWYLTGSQEKDYPTYWQARVRKDANLQATFEQIQKESSPVGVRDALAFAPPIPSISKNSIKLSKLETDFYLKVIAGTEKVDSYDKFLQDWKSQGGADCIKDANDWFKTAKK